MFEIQAFVVTVQMYADQETLIYKKGKSRKSSITHHDMKCVILLSQKHLVQEQHAKEINPKKQKNLFLILFFRPLKNHCYNLKSGVLIVKVCE